MDESRSDRLQHCLDRLRAGDRAARNDLLSAAAECLQRLTHKMLGDYRGVRRWEETGDVCQNALLRLYRALEEVTPPTVRDFYRLAAVQIRRELIDLSRHYYGAQGAGAHHASQAPDKDGSRAPGLLHEGSDLSCEPARLAAWTEFHRQAEALPAEEREVFDLLFYQGLSQEEAAAVLGVTSRTVKRYWRSARLIIYKALDGRMPGE